jgi:FlaA1/EpsC-like NDP-sugar epimerase
MSFGSGVIQSRRGFSPAGASAFRGDPISHHFIGPIIAVGDFIGLVLLGAVTGIVHDWLMKGAQVGKPIYIGLAGLAATLAVVSLYARGFYERSFVLSGDTIAVVLQVWLIVFAILAVTGFLLGISDEFSRGALLAYFIGGAGLLIVQRVVASSILRRAIRSGSLRGRRVAIIGDRNEISPDHLRKSLRQHGYSVSSCYLFDPGNDVAGLASEIPWGEIVDLGRSRNIDEVMRAVRWSDRERMQFILNMLKVLPISVRLLPDETAASLIQKPMGFPLRDRLLPSRAVKRSATMRPQTMPHRNV